MLFKYMPIFINVANFVILALTELSLALTLITFNEPFSFKQK